MAILTVSEPILKSKFLGALDGMYIEELAEKLWLGFVSKC